MYNPHKNLHLQQVEVKPCASPDRSSRPPPVKGEGGETPMEEEAVGPPHHDLEVLDAGICRRRRQEVLGGERSRRGAERSRRGE
jgi:hypothetical protein